MSCMTPWLQCVVRYTSGAEQTVNNTEVKGPVGIVRNSHREHVLHATPWVHTEGRQTWRTSTVQTETPACLVI